MLDDNMIFSTDLKDLDLPRNQIIWRSSAPFGQRGREINLNFTPLVT